MMRVTGYSLANTAVMQAEGHVPPGATPAYAVMPFARYTEELGERGIRIEERETSA